MRGNNDFVALELYHHAVLSPYITAKLELFSGVTVVDLGNSSDSCVSEALKFTLLHDIVLVDPSIVFIPGFGRQEAKSNSLVRPSALCSTEGGRGTIFSTSRKLDESIRSISASADCKNPFVYFHQDSLSKGLITESKLLAGTNVTLAETVGKLYAPATDYQHPSDILDSMIAFVYPINASRESIARRLEVPLYVGVPFQGVAYSWIEKSWREFVSGYRSLLLDRPVSWVAFDGGLSPNSLQGHSNLCSSFNSIEGAKRSLLIGGNSKRTVLNIDLVMAADEVQVGMHSETVFGPLSFRRNHLPDSKSISSLSLPTAQARVRNPCLPDELVRTWLDENKYRNYTSCSHKKCSEPISLAEQFLEEIALSEDAEIIFDLKAASATVQLNQAWQILQRIKQKREPDQETLLNRVAVRFFPDNEPSGGANSVIPNHLYDSITKKQVPLELRYYFNSPSRDACMELLSWAHSHNIRLAGCFVIENQIDISTSWNAMSKEYNSAIAIPPAPKDFKLICDVPRKQELPDTRLWKQGLVDCIENKFDWIHHPFPVSAKSKHVLQSMSSVAASKKFKDTVQSSLAEFGSKLVSLKAEGKLQADLHTGWENYASYWGTASPFSWTKQDQELRSVASEVYADESTDKHNFVFRCVSKILTVMLFLRLEELGLLSISDEIQGLHHKVTWEQVFSNTAGDMGEHAESSFQYSNSLWSHATTTVQNATELTFLEAMSKYILEPLGSAGSFDPETAYPPFPARGFVGSLDDILLIGSTLASGGVSPKTRLQILSVNSVQRMLRDSTRNVSASFYNDRATKSMDRFVSENIGFSSGVVSGYGLGLWRVSWRSDSVPGWLSIGSSETLLYFDTTGLVVGMASAQRVLGLELTSPFAKVVTELAKVDS